MKGGALCSVPPENQRSRLFSFYCWRPVLCSRDEKRRVSMLTISTITTKVKEAFIADPQVKASQINVETMQGVVQLSGFVDLPKSEARAVELARQVRGVTSVKDNILIRGAASQ